MPKKVLFDSKPNIASLEKRLWEAAEKLRKNIDAAEYTHLGLHSILLGSFIFRYDIIYSLTISENLLRRQHHDI
jgi:hypoxanthine-guanine phosphoribosyltransferase